MIFREAQLTDIPIIYQVRLAVKENALSNPSLITVEMYQDYLTTLGKGWVCELNGQIVGFVVAASWDNSIWALFIEPAYEGQGIGKQLLKIAVDWLFVQGAQQITLSTAANTRADRFYQAQGWVRGAMKDAMEVYYTLTKSANCSPLSY